MKRLSLIFICILSCCCLFAQPQAPNTPARPPRQAGIIPGQTPTSPKFEEYFEPVTTEFAVPDEDGFIRRWIILEPIAKPNRSNTVFTDSYLRDAFAHQYFKGQLSDVLPKDGKKETVEVDVTPAPMGWVMPGQTVQEPEQKFEKRKLQWHAVDSKLFNVKLFRFAAGLKKDVYGVVFYMATVIECEEDIPDVRLAVGSNAGSMWWLNGEEVLIMSSDRRMVMDDCMSGRITLKKGRNVLWGGIINGPGMSDACVRFVDESGNPVKNLKIYSK
ncbi:MAG: acetylxylan esterase [Bacteroidales bacterium]|nr:acetylxylan esterase [Bacteroidales bacterium]